MDTDAVDQRKLRRLLGGDDLAWLLHRMRRRLELGRPLTGTVTLAEATPKQRRAVGRLLGRRVGTARSLTVSLDELDRLVRASGAAADGLAAAAEVLLGTVPNRASEAAARQAAWSAAVQPVTDLVARRPELEPWRTWLDSTGLLRRLATDVDDVATLADQVVRVLDNLPSRGVALGRLAATVTGDAHALDDGRPLATLCLSAIRVLVAGTAAIGDGLASDRRATWASVGVHRDELSSTVLCLGLPGGTSTMVGRMIALATESGEPCALTLRQLSRDPTDLGRDLGVGDRPVHLCENPIVLASAADELGSACPPLVCLNGQPSTAVVRLLDLLAGSGATFAYHGDFDWGGIRIANALRARIDWTPWRYDTPAYQAALSSATGGTLIGRPADAAWDPELRPALVRHGVHVQEELVLADLIDDLGSQAGQPRSG
ncbi:MAG TPA: TIGR02679 family protein [Pseudonocardiaceae bacterium]|nr:TIGR02679 family protein [Pseudonocardiaceae bacterium]